MSQNADSKIIKVGSIVRVPGLSRQSPRMVVLYLNDTDESIKVGGSFGGVRIGSMVALCGWFSDGMKWEEVGFPFAVLDIWEDPGSICLPKEEVKESFEESVDLTKEVKEELKEEVISKDEVEDEVLRWSADTILEGKIILSDGVDEQPGSLSVQDYRDRGYIVARDNKDGEWVWLISRVPSVYVSDGGPTVKMAEELSNDTTKNFDIVVKSLTPDDRIIDPFADFEDQTIMNGQIVGLYPDDMGTSVPDVDGIKRKGYTVLREFNGRNWFWLVKKVVEGK